MGSCLVSYEQGLVGKLLLQLLAENLEALLIERRQEHGKYFTGKGGNCHKQVGKLITDLYHSLWPVALRAPFPSQVGTGAYAHFVFKYNILWLESCT